VASRIKLTAFIVAGLAVALALAFFVSPEASSHPDGLERVAIDEGFVDEATAHDLEDSPLADYGVEGVDNERLSTGLSGIIGVAVTFAVAGGAIFLYRHARRRQTSEPVASGHG
jgi:PDGLE domain